MNSIPKVTIVIASRFRQDDLFEGPFRRPPFPRFFDDFHGRSLDGTGAFAKSKHYEALKMKLKEVRIA